jgi:DNA-binding CsgD family transcriptional regulator
VSVARLTGSDYRDALEVLYAAGEVTGAVPFPEPVLETLRQLVPCDVVTYHEHSERPTRVLVHVGNPVGALTPEIHAAHQRFKHQDPFRPADGARTTSDFVDIGTYRRTELYQYVDRPLGIAHMLQLYVDPDGTDARLEFDRFESDFSERDRDVLGLLLPHLRQLVRHKRPGPGAANLTERERQVLEQVAEGRTNGEIAWTLEISAETVRKHLENAYTKLRVHTRTGAVAAAFGVRYSRA